MIARILEFLPRLIALSLAAIALAGCDSRRTAESPSESTSGTVALFKEGKGILFTEETESFLNTEVAEVLEKPVIRRFEKAAQVYRSPSLENPGGATVLLNAEEKKRVHVGQPVKLKSLDGGAEFTGNLIRIDASAQSAFGQVEALVEFAGSEASHPVGRFLNASFAAAEARPAFAVPKSALLSTAEGSFVYVVNGGWLTRTRVQPGTRDGDFVEVEDGLYAGDAIVTKGVENLWFVELSALKGGQPCCPVPKNKSGK